MNHYWLPILEEKNNNIVVEQHDTTANSLIIFGANGSGKSKLGAWIEAQDYLNIHRISAQRVLNFAKYIPMKSYEESEKIVMCSLSGNDAGTFRKDFRWKGLYDNNNRYNETTTVLNDFNYVLAALFALKNVENDKIIKKHNKAVVDGKQASIERETTIIDKAKSIWHSVLPQRDLVFEDAMVKAKSSSQGSNFYDGKDMSDGERVCLYLIAQVLCVPKNKTIIIDEPELHIHPSIMTKLWHELEIARPDCFFIYITHDVNFVAEHNNADIVWVKSYDGKQWDYKKVNLHDGLVPDEMLVRVMGNRRDVLFVEGVSGGTDYQVYSAVFPEFMIIPCGSCENVIKNVESFKAKQELHNKEVYGLIDRDYRSKEEIESLARNGVYALEVAEIENLFLTEEVLKVYCASRHFDETRIIEIKQRVSDRFQQIKNSQISEAAIHRVQQSLKMLNFADKKEEEVQTIISNFKCHDIYQAVRQEYEIVDDYKEILKVCNHKPMLDIAGSVFGVSKEDYCDELLRIINSVDKSGLINAMINYLPDVLINRRREN